jgi:hypothetical protein
MDHPPADRAILLACTLGSLQDYGLRVRCQQEHEAELPFRMLTLQGRGGCTVAEFLIRLRCRKCGARPKDVALHRTGEPLAIDWHGRRPWLVPLLGETDDLIVPPPNRPRLQAVPGDRSERN